MSFILALIVGGIVGALVLWLRSRDMGLTWYELLIGVVGVLLLLFTIQNYFGATAEFESTAANLFLLITGLPSLVLLAVTWQLAARRKRAA